MTDATGDGMAGTHDVSYSTQQDLKQTAYNGSKSCKGCGLYSLTPVQALYSELCPRCTSAQALKQVKGGMV
jgi:hypothetical protein